jgi:hypothetical protein
MFFFVFRPTVIRVRTCLACLIQIIQVLLCLMFYNDAYEDVILFLAKDKGLYEDFKE